MLLSEEFISFQGEGTSVGKLAYFIRTQGCNLRCYFCDTSHAQDDEGTETSVNEIIERVRSSKVPLVVITGGEPFLQPFALKDLVEGLLSLTTVDIEIETNGTLLLEPDSGRILLEWINSKGRLQLNISPKFPPILDYNVVFKYLQQMQHKYKSCPSKCILKFVIQEHRSEANVKQAMSYTSGWPKSQIYFMPEGATREEQLTLLPTIAEFAKQEGVNLSVRAHVLIWGQKRGV